MYLFEYSGKFHNFKFITLISIFISLVIQSNNYYSMFPFYIIIQWAEIINTVANKVFSLLFQLIFIYFYLFRVIFRSKYIQKFSIRNVFSSFENAIAKEGCKRVGQIPGRNTFLFVALLVSKSERLPQRRAKELFVLPLQTQRPVVASVLWYLVRIVVGAGQSPGFDLVSLHGISPQTHLECWGPRQWGGDQSRCQGIETFPYQYVCKQRNFY